MFNLKIAADIVGSLFPVIFPDQKFNGKRLAGVVLAVVLAVGSVKLLGIDGAEEAVEIAEDIMELSEE
jgi:hypothetical protein